MSGTRGDVVAIPLRFQIQDGLERSPSESATLVDKMVTLILETVGDSNSLIVADAYYSAGKLLKALSARGLAYVGKMKITTVAYEQPTRPSAPRRGRLRTRGEKLRLREFFDDESGFVSENLVVYGKRQDVLHQTFDLLWQGMLVHFVLSKLADGSRAILISTDLNLTTGEIITAYGLRQKIEVSFKSLVHTLNGFGYHFWMKEMKEICWTDGDQYLHRASKSYRAAVNRKLEAYERFVNIASIGLGILQVVGLKHTSYVWQRFPIWM